MFGKNWLSLKAHSMSRSRPVNEARLRVRVSVWGFNNHLSSGSVDPGMPPSGFLLTIANITSS